MRVRDLRAKLMKYGLGYDEVMKILDKSELEATLLRLTQQKETMKMYTEMETYWEECFQSFLQFCVENMYTIIIGLIIFFVFFVIPRDYIVGLQLFVVDYFSGYFFPIKLKAKSIKKSWKYGLICSLLCLLLAMAIEIYEVIIHISIPLGWVLSSASPIRKYFPFTLYIPISTQMIRKDLPSYGMNIGPQITLLACRYVRNKFENLGAKDVLEYRERRRRNNDMREE